MASDARLTVEKVAEIPWHSLSPDDALKELEASEEGLSRQEVEQRKETFGPNKLPEKKRAGLLRVFFRQFKDPLIYILLIAGIVSLAIGNLNNAIFIFAVLLINAVIGTFQEWKAEKGAEALQGMIKIRAAVQRDGKRQEVDSAELVPGDIVFLEAGASVPADIRLFSAQNLSADESLLTGESMPVDKDADPVLDEDTPTGDRKNLLHAGSSVMDGRARGVVCRTGIHTEVGKIAKSLAGEEAEVPPLVKRLQRFTRQIGILVLIAIGILSVLQLAQGAEPVYIFFLGVALAVSAIPAGLPVAITVAMSRASARMAVRHVIVRQLPAVEGLGSCTLVASDKTGTLTTNALTIKRLKMPDGEPFKVEGEGYDPQGQISRDGESVDNEREEQVKQLALTGVLCNEGEFHIEDGEVEQQGDTVDVAFLVFAAKLGLNRKELLDAHPEVAFIPFQSRQRFAASFNRMDGKVVAHVKGAAEALFPMCKGMDEETIKGYEQELAEQGYRMLALASGEVEDRSDSDYDAGVLKGLEFLGLAALIDPIRQEVPDAVARCHSAGVDVRMITGDHPATGLTIARQLKITGSEDKALTGKEFAELEADPDALNERIYATPVFARIEPTQKTKIIESLQAKGHFVAVTGDGVNDAPALKSAHIGVAMGKEGTDVARGAADLILTDDNFASIVNGIEEGRTAYDNVRRVTWLLLSTGAAEVLLFFLSIFTGLPLPLSAVQLLWLNLVTNGIQDVALAFEKGEPGVLDRPPRPPDQPIFDRQMIQQTALSGGYIGCVAFGVYYYLLEQVGMNEFDARNLLLLLMVLFENMHCFSCRSETRSLFRVPLRANPLLILAVIAAQGVHILAMFIPGLSDVLEIEPVSITVWLTLLPVAASLLVFDEAAKFIHARLRNHSAPDQTVTAS